MTGQYTNRKVPQDIIWYHAIIPKPSFAVKGLNENDFSVWDLGLLHSYTNIWSLLFSYTNVF